MQFPVRTLQTLATLLGLLAIALLVSGLSLYSYWSNVPPNSLVDSSGTEGNNTEVPSNYDPAKAEAAGLIKNATGEALFTNNCQQCHAINEIVVGPALGNVHNRRTTEWLHQFIKNSQLVIQSGDADAVKLYKEFNQTQMPAFNFKTAQIDSILAYIAYETKAYDL